MLSYINNKEGVPWNIKHKLGALHFASQLAYTTQYTDFGTYNIARLAQLRGTSLYIYIYILICTHSYTLVVNESELSS